LNYKSNAFDLATIEIRNSWDGHSTSVIYYSHEYGICPLWTFIHKFHWDLFLYRAY